MVGVATAPLTTEAVENSPQPFNKLDMMEEENRRDELVDRIFAMVMTPTPPTGLPVTGAQISFMEDLEQRYQRVSGLQDRSAYKIFYGPVRPAPVMVLGINPGGDPADVLADSLHRRNGLDSAASIGFYEHEECDLLDCNWPENRGLMKLLVPLFNGDQELIRTGVVKTNLAFRRSRKKTGIDFENAKREAAPFLLEILGVVQPRLILLTSVDLSTFAKTFGTSITPLDAPLRDDRVGQVVFEAAAVVMKGTGAETLVVRVAHASQFSWTYEKYGVVSRIHTLGFP